MKQLPEVYVAEKNPDRIVGQVALWLFAAIGFIDLLTGGALWH